MRTAFLLLVLLLVALPVSADETKHSHPKEFLGTWTFVVTDDMRHRLAEAESALVAFPEDEDAKEELYMAQMWFSLETRYGDAVESVMRGQIRDSRPWSARKNEDGSWSLDVYAPDGSVDTNRAVLEGDTLAVTVGSNTMRWARKK